MAGLIRAAELGLIRPEEFRKNAVKFGWELWQKTEGGGEIVGFQFKPKRLSSSLFLTASQWA